MTGATFGLCMVCFQSTFGVCCVTCRNLLQCIGPDPSTDLLLHDNKTPAKAYAYSVSSSSSTNSEFGSEKVKAMDIDSDTDVDSELDSETDVEADADKGADITIIAQDPYRNGASLITSGIQSQSPFRSPSARNHVTFGPLRLDRATTVFSSSSRSYRDRGEHLDADADAELNTESDLNGTAAGTLRFPGCDEPAFPADVALNSVRILVKGHEPYSHEHRANTPCESGKTTRLTRGELAATLAEDVQRFLVREAQSGNPLHHGGKEAALDRLFLLGVDHDVSTGILQPVIGISTISD
ncbi:hypothetical protein C8Q74DRAFT_1215258 [Fomes fomentarius]|nr:hypothetical protein C8Q74DRAFT_1215258 [Fomes fomentarius]